MDPQDPCNWLQVFQWVNAGHLSHRGGQEWESPIGPSEKGVALSGSKDDVMRMISTRFARVLQRSLRWLDMHFLSSLQ